MIGSLTGKVHAKGDESVVVDVQGVGYELSVGRRTLDAIGFPGDSVSLEVYTHVAEGVLQLIGFSTSHDKNVFKKLISISGIGPRMALAILSGLTADELIRAIVGGDLAALTAVSGVGKKTAERLVIELRDKFKDDPALAVGPRAGVARFALGDDINPLRRDAVAALISLGYAEVAARRALSEVVASSQDSVQMLIKKSLGVLSR